MLIRKLFVLFFIVLCSHQAVAQMFPDDSYPIFNDKLLIEGYAGKLASTEQDVLLAMINDDTLAAYRKAAAVRVFRLSFVPQIVSTKKTIVEKILLRQLERSASPFVQIELMFTLLTLDRYRYFDTMVPALIQKIDHYDYAVSEMAYKSVEEVNAAGSQRSREARIVFNTLRKIFFLMRKKLVNANPDDLKLKSKLELLRWSVKVLGTGELKNVPKEVLSLM